MAREMMTARGARFWLCYMLLLVPASPARTDAGGDEIALLCSFADDRFTLHHLGARLDSLGVDAMIETGLGTGSVRVPKTSVRKIRDVLRGDTYCFDVCIWGFPGIEDWRQGDRGKFLQIQFDTPLVDLHTRLDPFHAAVVHAVTSSDAVTECAERFPILHNLALRQRRYLNEDFRSVVGYDGVLVLGDQVGRCWSIAFEYAEPASARIVDSHLMSRNEMKSTRCR